MRNYEDGEIQESDGLSICSICVDETAICWFSLGTGGGVSLCRRCAETLSHRLDRHIEEIDQ